MTWFVGVGRGMRALAMGVVATAAMFGCGADGEAPDDERDAGADAGGEPGPPRRVLFLGNSYTYFNDLPALVTAIGEATPGRAIEAETIAEGGATFADHWMNANVQTRLDEGDLDAVVLQAQSLEPVFGAEGFVAFGELLGDAVAEAGADGVWFSTWARRDGDPIYAGGLDPASLTESLELRYRGQARRHDDRVARVGAAWQLALDELPGVDLYAPDGSHPTLAGSWLAACVIHQAITARTPRVPDPPPDGLPADTAAALCALAARVVCPEGETLCAGACVQTATDAAHCGGCGRTCDGEDPCRDGVCGCPEGRTGCGRVCRDLERDPLHCGRCGVECATGERCAAGACACMGAAALDFAFDALREIEPACDGWDDAGSLACGRAAHAWCGDLACFDSGVPPVTGHAPRPDRLGCVSADLREVGFDELAAFEADCDEPASATSAPCVTAIARFCAARGAVGGFGPVALEGARATVACVDDADVVRTDLETLKGHASRCVPDPVSCSAAAWNLCEALGYAGGFGPVDAAGDDRDIVCLGTPETAGGG